MLELPDVTLCCVDTANHALALRALARSCEGVSFAGALLLTDALPHDVAVPSGIDVVPIAPLVSRDAYSEFVLKSLLPHIATTHALLVQWDGYVTNPAAWDPAFLECDYIGAKWFWYQDGMRVGNGGFSLRSQRLLEALQDPRITLIDAEDLTIGRSFRPLLERDYSIRFATEGEADRFSFEAAYPIGKPFGFHGLFNFCRSVPPEEIAVLCPGFSDTIARSPQLLQLLRNCAALGQWNAAVAIGRRIVAAAPDNAEAHEMLREAERRATAAPVAGRNDPCPCGSGKKFKQCHGSLSGAVAPAPPGPDIQVRSALEAHRKGDIDGAERGYRAALAAAPQNPLALHYLGVVMYQRQRLGEAIPLLERSVSAHPQEPEFHNNLGLALAAADRHDDAIAAYRRVLALKPDHAVAWNNLGLALQSLNRVPEAIAAFREALALQPDFAQAHWNVSLALLAHGEFAEGWREYEWRLRIAELGKHSRTFEGPRWNGVPRRGLRLLVTAEQGLGDALQFIRFATLLSQREIRVIIAAPKSLARLLASVPGVAEVVTLDGPPPPHDAHVPLLSLPGLLGIGVADIPSAVPYIAADTGLRTEAIAALRPYASRLKAGLAWAGNKATASGRQRSMPIAALTPLFDIPDVVWVSLQPVEDAAPTAAVNGARGLVELPLRNDFDGTAALVAELDLIVTVDTSIAHLAGALAKPVWILLPFAADWRWQQARTVNAWYPTARLFRQPAPGQWDAAVRDMIVALRES